MLECTWCFSIRCAKKKKEGYKFSQTRAHVFKLYSSVFVCQWIAWFLIWMHRPIQRICKIGLQSKANRAGEDVSEDSREDSR
jgi:hypothetical protein